MFTVPSRQFHLWDSLHHDSALLSDLLINGTHNSTLRKRVTLETRTPNDKHAHSRRTAPQESGDNSPEQGGESNQRWPRNNTLRRPSTSRVHAQSQNPRPRLLTSMLYCETSNYRQTVVFTRQKLRHTTKTGSQHLLV